MSVKESWVGFFRLPEPVNASFSTTAPSLHRAVQSHGVSWPNTLRFWLKDRRSDVRTWIFNNDCCAFWKAHNLCIGECAVVSTRIWHLKVRNDHLVCCSVFSNQGKSGIVLEFSMENVFWTIHKETRDEFWILSQSLFVPADPRRLIAFIGTTSGHLTSGRSR